WPGVFRLMAEELQRLVEGSPRRPILIEIDEQELSERIARLESGLLRADAHQVHRLRAELSRLRAQASAIATGAPA
ncbi:MAG TPA: hypothetical protein PK867_00755, partial [Pirellulales bacterium]|nr:hypothetical protein [Pirellulales bacterium]